MNWPNKISIDQPTTARHNSSEWWVYRNRMSVLMKWCEDNLSSRGVLWEWGFSEDSAYMDQYSFLFYFAQPQDAIMFRLIHGV